MPDGTTVTVLAPEGDETFALNASEQAELIAAISAAEGGELVSVTNVLQDVRRV